VRRCLTLLALLLVGLAAAWPAAAHEVRPAYLEIDQVGPASYKVTWKQPTLGDVALHLAPHLSSGWLEAPPADQYAGDSSLIRTWVVHAAPHQPLDGQTLSIEGLSGTITDVFVRVRMADGQKLDALVRPEAPALKIDLAHGADLSMWSLLLLGIQHIVTGPDHLAFLLGLLLIVKDRWTLVKTVSAFTLAHSLTLAAATFGLISLSVPLLNALIALSILFVAPEAIRAQSGGTSLTIRHPWAIAFGFGLLHGMGFASGLTSLGLEKSALLGALVLFNVGVEIGQLAFIMVVLALLRAFRLMEIRWPKPVRLAPTYAIGAFGASWTLQYGAALFGLA
jgi:hypothetical protein